MTEKNSVVSTAAYDFPVYEPLSGLSETLHPEPSGLSALLDTAETIESPEWDSVTSPDTASIQIPSEYGDTLNPLFPIHWSEPLEQFPESQPADSVFQQTFRLPYRGGGVARPWMRSYPRLYYIALPGEEVTVRRLPGGNYLAVRSFDGRETGLPGLYTFRQYADEARRAQMRENWAGMIREASRQDGTGASLLDFRFDVPGGRESAFTTIFGRPEINLRVNGMANMNAGVSVQHVADPSLPPDQQTRIDPRFDQNLQLNIQGTIGDKLTIRTDWDTERTFDYQNLLYISYQGYEDEILKEVEMGNVSMQTGNSLIRGSESLFGIRSAAELGSFRLTSVLSQQKGESNVETIIGGEQEQQISLHPADYQNHRHFFLDFYTRQEFELSMSDPQQRIQTLPFAEINVWVLTDQVQAEEGARLAVALSDYGVVENPDGSYSPPDNQLDPFDEQQLQPLRDPSVGITASDLGLSDSRNYEEGYFRPLREGEDYTVDRVSGFISLSQSLSSREVLAVSFTYQGSDGQTVSVGDMAQGGTERIFLKMLRPRNLSTDHRTFPLTMRNVYSLGVSDLRQENVELELLFTEGNVAQNRLPARSTTLLEDLGLDRVDSQGGLEPDNRVDFGTGTLDAVFGRVIFPWLEPFGDRLEQLLREGGVLEEEIDQLVYNELYNEQQRNAERVSANSFYRMSGTVRGGAQENFTLDFALVEGSVRVYANGMELQEGVDYQVDYSFGSITILNDRYTASGQEIRIEYENQALTSIEQKTFTGVRAEYQLSRGMSVGGTWFRYMERPLDDKIRIGDEPINNMMLGLDTSMDLELPFLTDWLDALPVLSTRERSGVTFSGEFAQLLPGVSQTRAVRRAIDNNELYPDEEEGVSFVDDFEGSSVRINLMNPIRWNLAAVPAAIPGYEADEVWFEENLQVPGSSPLDVQADRADLRSAFAWYSIPRNITSILDGVDYTPESQQVRVEDVFPGRQTENPQEEFITTMDVWFNPGERGPYNYNRQLRELLEETPERTWGGMTTVLPSGQEDFSQNNIEFLEFWVQPLLTGGREPSPTELESYEGTIYVDIGTISEDVVPNAKLNSEDGLATNPEQLIPDRAGNPRSYIPSSQPPPEGQFSTSNRHLEDVGLDGLPATDGVGGRSERVVFSDFVEAMRTVYDEDSEEILAINSDPSNDQYRFYGEEELEGLPLHERFHRMLGYYEGNTPIDQSDRRAVTNRPNTEGLVNPGRIELDNAYFQYEMEFNPGDPEHNYIVDRVTGPRPDQRWYQVRIPLDEFVRQVGDISDFQNISYIRIWMSGYEEPFTLRFATLDFIGSQWQKAETINRQSDPGADFNVTTLNIEENSNRRPVPYRQPRGGIRAQNRGSQLQSLQNEQSIVLEADGLGPGGVQLVRRNFPGGLNLLHYSNLRMFVHGEGFDRRGDAELVMRFGNDLENSYYEYRQPVSPSDVDYPWQSYDPVESGRMELEAEQVWLYEENSMNILLQAFNQLKQLRDQASGDLSDRYERSDLLEEAVPGAVIAVKGNPSLDRVNEIGMGIRNPFDPENPSGPGVPSLHAQFWMNELRVSGFDNQTGWAANAKTSLQLADVVMLTTSIEQQTDGFGSLNSRLGNRRMSDQIAWDLNTTLYLDRFLPERYGWSIPVSFTTRRSTLTPRYLPNEGDIRLDDFRQAVRSREDLSPEVQEEMIRQRIFDIQTYSEFYSLNLSNLSKRNSDGWLARYTLDNTTFSYVYNTTDSRNPQHQFQDSWNFNTSLRYSHSFREARFVTPLGFMEGVPVAGLLSGLSVGLMPNQVSASIRMNRMYEERRRRNYDLSQEAESLQQTHNFGYQTSFGFGYNLLRSLTTTFQADGGFDLNRISQRGGVFSGPDSTAYEVRPTLRVLEDLLTDDRIRPRRSTYQESYTAAWQPRIDRIGSMDWVTYSFRYGGGFRWENAPYGSDLGARVANSFRMDHTLRLETERLLERLGLFDGVREAEERAGSTRQESVENGNGVEGEGFGFGERLASAGRRTLLGLVSLQSFEVGYNDSKTGSQAGYSGGSGFFDQFGSGPGSSPSFLYRTGFDERLGLDRLVGNPDSERIVQFPINNSYSDQLTFRARFQPFRNVSVDLTWEANWDERTTESVSFSGGEIQTVSGASGNMGSSVWAFGPGYRDLFERQVQTGFDGIVADADSIGRADGRLLMNRLTLQEDFRSAYLGGESTVGGKGFMPFPMPGWRINWMGIEELIPVIGSYMQGASITHAYTGRYRLGWGFNSNPGELSPRRIGSYVVSDERSEFEPTSVNVERRFAPLVQLSITWDRNLRTRIGYEVSRMTSMALSNVQVTERTSRGLTTSVTYTIRHFKLPFFRPLNNNLDVTLAGNLIEDTEQRFLLDSDISNAFSEGHEFIERDPSVYRVNPRSPSGQTRVNASTILGYRFSSRVQANFEYAFSHTLPKSSSTFRRTTHDFRFSIRINFRSV
ncbi:MAG: cell surface protein SprA [Balneolaceae bacterium]